MKKILTYVTLATCVMFIQCKNVNAAQADVQSSEAGQIQLIPEQDMKSANPIVFPGEVIDSSTDNVKVNSSSSEKKKPEKENSSSSSTEKKTEPKKNNAKSKFAKANKERDYVIKVNLAMNCVTVYIEENGQLKPYKAMACSSGRDEHDTPEGEFKTYEYYDWRLMVDNTYGRYAVRFNGQIMFHSVPYLTRNKNSLEWDQYNMLGERASLGCIRLCVGDAKWIYDNCKKGTKVIVYSDKSSPGPLGKPKVDKIPEKSPNRDWDPTDLTPENPWLVTVE